MNEIPPTPIHGPRTYIVPDMASQTVPPPMSRREWFAAMAMQGLMANVQLTKLILSNKDRGFDLTTAAVEMADQLIVELAKGQKP